MTTDTFHASVQYNDFKGTSAADRADKGDADDWLEANEHKKPGEFLLGITLWAGEYHGKHEDPVSVTFLLASLGDHDSVKKRIESDGEPVEVRRVHVDMKLTEFFGLFKRFSVAFSAHGMLNDREYTYVE